MIITSTPFILMFLPVSLAVYYLVGDNIKKYVLLAISFLFYAFSDIEFFFLFIVYTVITVCIGRLINSINSHSKARLVLLFFGIVINLTILCFYKTASQNNIEITLPLGISFFTFKAISYLVDIYKGEARLTDNPVNDALYLSIFTQITSGPLSRILDMEIRESNFEFFSNGVYRMLIGISKKILLANMLGNIVNEVFTTPLEEFSVSYAWLGAVCYSLQLLFDFSGYSDIAIGLSAMFGYHCPENFYFPYMTESVSKFWRRWHISLGAWFRDYVYIPLGGAKRGMPRVIFNLFIVWFLTGIWHGISANFIFWGLAYFIAISFEKISGFPGRLKSKMLRVFYRILTLFFINFQWVIFRADSLMHGLRFIRRMLYCLPNAVADARTMYLIRNYAVVLIAAVVLCFPIVELIKTKTENNKYLSILFSIVLTVVVAYAFVLSLSMILIGQSNPFAYANF